MTVVVSVSVAVTVAAGDADWLIDGVAKPLVVGLGVDALALQPTNAAVMAAARSSIPMRILIALQSQRG